MSKICRNTVSTYFRNAIYVGDLPCYLKHPPRLSSGPDGKTTCFWWASSQQGICMVLSAGFLQRVAPGATMTSPAAFPIKYPSAWYSSRSRLSPAFVMLVGVEFSFAAAEWQRHWVLLQRERVASCELIEHGLRTDAKCHLEKKNY